jgi:hypothetical protein
LPRFVAIDARNVATWQEQSEAPDERLYEERWQRGRQLLASLSFPPVRE